MKSKKLTAVTTLSHVAEGSKCLQEIGAKPRSAGREAHWLLTAGLAAGLLLAGCGKKQESQPASTAANPAAASTSAPSSAGQSQASAAPNQNPAGQSQSSQTQAGPNQASGTNTTQAAAPAPPPPPTVHTVPRGTRLEVRVSQTISAKDNNVGDGFRGVLVRSIRVGGVTVLRAGTPVSGTVVAAKGQGRFKGAGDLGIDINRVGGQPVTTTAYEKVVKGKGKRSAGFIGGGGGGGALIGGLAGGGKGALIGGLVGAGAGTAGAAFTGNQNVTIPAESVVSVALTAPLRITGAAAPAASPQ